MHKLDVLSFWRDPSKYSVAKREALLDQISENIRYEKGNDCCVHLVRLSVYSLSLKLDESLSGAFQDFYRNLTIDVGMDETLKENKIINWSRQLQHSLKPIKTQGDGNCLAHAVSLALWGIPDFSLILRRIVCVCLYNDNGSFRSRWEIEQRQLNNSIPDLESMGFASEWELILNQSSYDESSNPPQLKFIPLQNIHVFVLANVLRRPIIVCSHLMIKSQSGLEIQANAMMGIYLPLLWKPEQCVSKSPIILAYDKYHFSPLVVFDSDEAESMMRVNAIPLISSNGAEMPLRFATNDEKEDVVGYLKRYLAVVSIYVKKNGLHFYVAELSNNDIPEEYNVMSDHFKQCLDYYNTSIKKDDFAEVVKHQTECLIKNCSNTADYSRDRKFCKECFEQFIVQRGTLFSQISSNSSAEVSECVNDGCKNQGHPRQNDMCMKCFILIPPKAPTEAPKLEDSPIANDEMNDIHLAPVICKCKDDTCHCAMFQNWQTRQLEISENDVRRNLIERNPQRLHSVPTKNDPITEFSLSCAKGHYNDFANNTNEPFCLNFTATENDLIQSSCQNYTDDQFDCTSPFCNNSASGRDQLCNECLSKLAEERSKDDKRLNIRNIPLKCLSEGCEFFGTSDSNGLCSNCYKKQNFCKTAAVPKDKAAINQVQSKETVNRGYPCNIKQCSRFGDDAMKGYCTRCFDFMRNTGSSDSALCGTIRGPNPPVVNQAGARFDKNDSRFCLKCHKIYLRPIDKHICDTCRKSFHQIVAGNSD